MSLDNVQPAPGSRSRVVIIDDDTVIRVGTPMLLPGVDIAGTFPDVDQFLAAAPVADVVVLDLTLTGTGVSRPIQGAAAIRTVSAAGYRVLIYTNERRRAVLAGCLAAGAAGIVHKAEPVAQLHEAIDRVALGETTITPALAGLAELIDRYGELPTLTNRQREILSRRARGEPFQQIATRFGISRRTAEDHMSDAGKKFASYLRDHSAADLERYLGIGEGDLLHE